MSVPLHHVMPSPVKRAGFRLTPNPQLPMNILKSKRSHLPILIAALAVLPATKGFTQIATIDISNPTNPIVTADVNPDIYAPDLPPNPTQIYVDEVSLPSTNWASYVAAKNATGLAVAAAYVVLLDEGLVLGSAYLELGPDSALQPAIVTNDTPPAASSTYSTYPPVVYYTPPANMPPTVSTTNAGPFNFDFGTTSGPVASGYVQVTDKTGYNATRGYGWGDTNQVSSQYNPSVRDPLECDWCTVSQNGTPFYLDLTNGYYSVSVSGGNYTANRTIFSVRANGAPEGSINIPGYKYAQVAFPIEISDNRLRLEFIGSSANVNAITITPDNSPHKPTIFVAGDSTAAAYAFSLYPLTGWGDRLKNYFTADVAISDNAVAGTSSRSFMDNGFFDLITSRLRPGDYLFICFGINDRYSDDRHTDPETTYKAYLRQYVNATRAHGAIPVFVAQQTMRTYDPFGRFYNNVGGYPQAMRELAPDINVPLLDLNQKSINLFDVVGVAATGDMFMYFAAGMYPGWPNGDADHIHFQDRGATALAKQVVDAVRELNLPIAEYIPPVPQPAIRPAPRSSYK